MKKNFLVVNYCNFGLNKEVVGYWELRDVSTVNANIANEHNMAIVDQDGNKLTVMENLAVVEIIDNHWQEAQKRYLNGLGFGHKKFQMNKKGKLILK